MDIKEFEALAADNPHELVRVKIVDGFAPYEKDSIAGFPAEEAFRLFGRGAVVPVDEKGAEIKGKANAKPAPEKRD